MLRPYTTDGLVVPGGVAVQEVRGEQRDIGASLAQWGEPDLDRVETKQQIFTEATGLHLRLDVGVGGRDDAHVGTARATRPRARIRLSRAHAAASPAAGAADSRSRRGTRCRPRPARS